MKTKLDYFNKQGWGYADSYFIINEKRDKISFVGPRYSLNGKWMDKFVSFGESQAGIDIKINDDGI